MKQCPKCKKMNNAYTDKCIYCGHEIKWIPDDGSGDEEPSNFSAEESKFQDSGTNNEERYAYPDKASLDDISNQLEDIKGQMKKGVNLFDVTMPFDKMVVLIIKLTFASIPAMMIMGMISLILSVLFSGLFFRQMMHLFQTMGHGMH